MASASCLIEGARAAKETAPGRGALRPLTLPAGISRGRKVLAPKKPAAAAAAADATGFGDENKEPAVDYLLTVEYKPFNRQDHDTFSAEQMKKYHEAADFFDELRVMLAESQRKLREECGYVVDN